MQFEQVHLRCSRLLFIFAPMSRKKEKEIVRGVTVESVGAEGKAVARIDNAVPGDVVAVRIDKRREKYFEGTLVEIEQPSPDRVEPFCEHYKDCGGCAWQELPYHLQLKYKQQQVVDQFSRIGHLPMDQVKVLPILPSERTTEYRNKLEFTFSDRRWLLSGEDPSTVFDPPVPLDPSEFEGGVFPRHLRGGYSSVNGNPAGFALGFHISKAFDKILDIRHCWLQPEPSNEIRNFIRQYAIVHGLPGFRPEDCDAEAEKLFDVLMERFPQIKSLNYLYNGRMNDAINDQEILNARGEDAIYEEMEGLRFKIGPKSFYQTNPLQAYRLYSTVREFADFQGGEHVYDLYTGTGTIALFVARSVASVVGVEYVPEAIADAKVNARINGIDNCRFYAGDMKDILTPEFVAAQGASPDVVILDPPRAGVHPSVIEVLLGTGARKIVYVSCNPATQARDLAMLTSGGAYRLVRIRPVDMFPHTTHVENVALLEKVDC